MPIRDGSGLTCPTPRHWPVTASPGEAGKGPSCGVQLWAPRGCQGSCPPDGDLELLLRRHQEAAEGLVRLVEAHQQDLPHPRHLGRERAVGRAAPAPRSRRPPPVPAPAPGPGPPYLSAGLDVVLHHGHAGHGEERLGHLEGQRPEPGPCAAGRSGGAVSRARRRREAPRARRTYPSAGPR